MKARAEQAADRATKAWLAIPGNALKKEHEIEAYREDQFKAALRRLGADVTRIGADSGGAGSGGGGGGKKIDFATGKPIP